MSRPLTTIVTYAAEASNPVLPVRDCMTANVNLRFVLVYGLPETALDQAASDITAALAAGDLTALPVHSFRWPTSRPRTRRPKMA